MNKAAIKAFAVSARKLLIAMAADNAAKILARGENQELSDGVKEIGLYAVAEEAAYVWFTRICAVRYMEVNGYLPGGVRVLSSKKPEKKLPDILAAVPKQERSDAVFTALFLEVCRNLGKQLPDYFENRRGYTDLLISLSYRDEDGIIRNLVDTVPEEEFKGAVEIVGWMYQYYNCERKNEAINLTGGRVKREDVPAATQFFTTDWVVQYMVNNSLGKYWLERSPQSRLKEKLEYYLGRSGSVAYQPPQEIKVLDPCMGGGHILVYAFDLLIEIYAECGVSSYEAAELILKKNLFGLDIDRRSYQLTYFALFMKARFYNQDILSRNIKLNLYEIRESNAISKELIAFAANGSRKIRADLQKVTAALYDAGEYGSIISIEPVDFVSIYRRMEEVINQNSSSSENQKYMDEMKEKLLPLVRQAEVMAGKYEVVVTNPPYLNKMDRKLKHYVSKHYHDYCGDLFSVFMYRNFEFCKEGGYCAFMSPFVWMFIKTYEKLREYIIQNKSISSLIQLEYSAFEEATVPICTFVLKNGPESEPGVYLKLSDFKGGMEVQRQKVTEAIKNPACGYRFEISSKSFASIPGMPIAYWGGRLFSRFFTDAHMIDEKATVTNGLFTCDNKRFLRYWYEVPPEEIFFDCADREQCEKSEKKWYPYNKGGDFRKWYGNHSYVVNFQNFGEAIRDYRVQSGQSASFPGQNYYFKPSISWSLVSSSKFGVRYYPAGFVFDIAGSSVFTDDPADTNYYLGFLSSRVAFEILNFINPTLNYQAGNIAKLPIRMDESHKASVGELVAENIAISKEDWDSFEVSWNFKVHPLIALNAKSKKRSSHLKTLYADWEKICDARCNRLKENEEKLNEIFIALYNLQNVLTPAVEEITVRRADLARDIRSLLSFAVGCIFGRFRAEGFSAGTKSDILLMTRGVCFQNDITARFVKFIRDIFGEDTLEENLGFIAQALGGKGSAREGIADYFFKGFYKDHIKTYQKRPIYWLFDGGSVQALCYVHSYNENTLEHAAVYFAQAQILLACKAETLAEQKREAALKHLAELERYRSKLEKVAVRHIPIDLDDGILYNYQKIQGGEGLLKKIL